MILCGFVDTNFFGGLIPASKFLVDFLTDKFSSLNLQDVLGVVGWVKEIIHPNGVSGKYTCTNWSVK